MAGSSRRGDRTATVPNALSDRILSSPSLAPPPQHAAMARRRPVMLLVLAVALLVAARWQLTAMETECVHGLVPYDGQFTSANFVVVGRDIFRSSDHPDPGIDFTVISGGDNTVYMLKGTSGEKFEFKAPRGGMYKFCFHNPYGAPETVTFYIHDGRKLVVVGPNTYKEEAMKKTFDEWMTRYHRTYKEEDMKKRFEDWTVEYNRSYADEEEKARRYKLFKGCAKTVDKLNAFQGGATTNDFCDQSEDESRLSTGGLIV
ncbi:unnamed protein product [Alopecurus aequalis]